MSTRVSRQVPNSGSLAALLVYASGLKYLFEAGKALLTGTRPDVDRDPRFTARSICREPNRRSVTKSRWPPPEART